LFSFVKTTGGIMRWRWAWVVLVGLLAGMPARGQSPVHEQSSVNGRILSLGPGETWLDMPVLTQDPNTLQIPPGIRVSQVLTGWRTQDCPSGAYLHMKRWVCFDWYRDLLTSPGPYYGKDIRTQGFMRVTPGGQMFLVPSREINEGPERIRVEGSASSLPPLKDGDAVFVAGTFEKEDAAHAPGLGVLSNAHDVVFAEFTAWPGVDSLLPRLQLKTPEAVATAPPMFGIAPQPQ